MLQNALHQRYQQLSVQTASSAQLLIMLYNGAIRFTKAAIDGIETKRYDIANLNFQKAQAIIHELTAALDFKYSISNDLARIYEYLIHQLIQANLRKSSILAKEVLGHLEELAAAWKEAALKNKNIAQNGIAEGMVNHAT